MATEFPGYHFVVLVSFFVKRSFLSFFTDAFFVLRKTNAQVKEVRDETEGEVRRLIGITFSLKLFIA